MRTPYKAWAGTYFDLGWSPIPLPSGDKSPPPDHRSGGCTCDKNTRCQKYTGGSGKYVDKPDIEAWTAPLGRARSGGWTFPPGNIALRLPKTVIGIDVDTYDGKAGATTLAAAEKLWGKLPATWVSGNRVSTPLSGIRLYRLPERAWELDWPESLKSVSGLDTPLGGGVEIIRWDHRFCVVSPSIHPDGRVYFWRSPDGAVIDLAAAWNEWATSSREGIDGADDGPEFEIPDISELTAFPEPWLGGLTGGRRRGSRAGLKGGGDSGPFGDSEDPSRAEGKVWLAERTSTLGPELCAVMDRTMTKYVRDVRRAGDEGGAHDVARDGAWAVIGDAFAGHAGVEKALTALRTAFLAAIADRRGGSPPTSAGHTQNGAKPDGALGRTTGSGGGNRIATAEWERIVLRAIGKIAREGDPEESDRCAYSASTGNALAATGGGRGGGNGRRRVRAGNVFDYPRDDRGNARRLYNALGKGADVRWSPGAGGWFLWNEATERWVNDVEGLALRAIWSDVVDDMQVEADELELEDDKAKMAIIRFAAGCGNLARTNTCMELLKTLPGVAVAPTVFDADERLLLCENGVIELTANGAIFRPTTRGDYLTLCTGTRYVPDADVALTEAGVNPGAALWEGFLADCLQDTEVRTWVQAAIGYSLLGANPERLLFICQGPTSTGKSTFVEAIRRTLGDHAGTFKFSLFKSEKEQGSNVALVRLLPKRFIATSEASQAQHLHVDEIKRLIGNEAIDARLNNANEMVIRVPAFTPWISTNDSPTINGADMALFRRLVTIPFPNQVTESEDVNLGERLSKESQTAILAWCVRGWNMYAALCRSGSRLRQYPEAVTDAIKKMRGEISDFAVWLTNRTEPADSETVTRTDDLWADWESWCDVNNVPVGPKPAFGRNLVRNGYLKAQGRSGDARYWGYRAIRIRL